jgi:hypothetical protein
MGPTGPETKINCVGKGQQQMTRPGQQQITTLLSVLAARPTSPCIDEKAPGMIWGSEICIWAVGFPVQYLCEK